MPSNPPTDLLTTGTAFSYVTACLVGSILLLVFFHQNRRTTRAQQALTPPPRRWLPSHWYSRMWYYWGWNQLEITMDGHRIEPASNCLARLPRGTGPPAFVLENFTLASRDKLLEHAWKHWFPFWNCEQVEVFLKALSAEPTAEPNA